MTSQHLSLASILERWIAGESIDQSDREQLVAWETTDRAAAFEIAPENVEAAVEHRLEVLAGLRGQFDRFPIPVNGSCLVTLWTLWLPLAISIAQIRQTLDRPLVQGVLGGQGMGKTTLAAMLKIILAQLGYSMVGISIDDLYKTYADRQRLRERDPRFIRRGPPGTHDVDLGVQTLDCLCRVPSSAGIEVPRFDKSLWNGEGDRIAPETIEGADIILFEGWFVGVRCIDPVVFDNPPHPIATAADIAFAREMNQKLAEYLPLWERLDRLLVLHPRDYRLSQKWRLQAEHQAISSGKAGMSDDEIREFVEYFWKSLHPELYIDPLTRNPEFVDLVVSVEADRTISRVYRPI
ncbi:MAG: glycerate kinase [Cyanobacteriota bacterium]|nr:glycerate kinase [Cyanobacteriota bacterium]